MGVKFDKRAKTNAYVAYVWENGKAKHLGSYCTRELAEIASARYDMQRKGLSEEQIQKKILEIQAIEKNLNLKFGVLS